MQLHSLLGSLVLHLFLWWSLYGHDDSLSSQSLAMMYQDCNTHILKLCYFFPFLLPFSCYNFPCACFFSPLTKTHFSWDGVTNVAFFFKRVAPFLTAFYESLFMGLFFWLCFAPECLWLMSCPNISSWYPCLEVHRPRLRMYHVCFSTTLAKCLWMYPWSRL